MGPFLKFAESFACSVLVLAGIAGLAFHLFEPGGWLIQALGGAWTLETHYGFMTIPVIGAAIWIGHKWFSGMFEKGDVAGNVMLFALMAAGLFFIGRLIFGGGF